MTAGTAENRTFYSHAHITHLDRHTPSHTSHHIFFLFWLSLLSLAWKGLSRKALIVTAKVVTRMTEVVTRLEDVGLQGFDSDSLSGTLDGHRFDNKKPTL